MVRHMARCQSCLEKVDVSSTHLSTHELRFHMHGSYDGGRTHHLDLSSWIYVSPKYAALDIGTVQSCNIDDRMCTYES